VAAFTGRTIVVTGASTGIGRSLALELARQQPKLVLAARDAERLEAVAAECRARGAQAIALEADVTVPEDCGRVVERAVAQFDGLDVLVNNAGISMIARFDEIRDLSVFEKIVRVNYLGAVYMTHHALPHLKRSGGLIVAVASLTGLTGVPTRTGYSASKHAMVGFFDSLRVELLGSGVDVTVVAPDFVVSEIHRRSLGPDGRPLGTTPMQESKIMSAAECARRIAGAMERRQRLAVLSLRGRLGRYVRLFAPGLIDRIALKAVREGK
jgi:short-subunit dehydrogenase